MTDHPHGDQPVKTAGTALEDAERAMIMVHGRGASAQSILQLAGQLPQDDTAFLAPQASGHQWYPESFLEPVEQNEPGRSSALQVVSGLIEQVNDAAVATTDTYLLGFSQGGCVVTEYAARNPQRYGGVFGLSGGLIGEEIEITAYDGDMEQTPVFLGCSDRDPHIPRDRVDVTAAVFDQLNAAVEKRLYEGMGHTINEDELSFIRDTVSTE